jgi:type IV pilus assembly protein PilN
VILINLLPHREAARKRRRDRFNASLGAAALAGLAICAGVFSWYQSAINAQQLVNGTLEAEIKKLEAKIKDIGELEAEIAALRARQQAVENLQSDRNLPVHLLTELVNQLPDGVYIAKMTQSDQSVTLNGVAQSNERVSELLRNLSGAKTPWLTKPELIEIVTGTVSLSPKDVRRVSNFMIKVQLLRASEVEKMVAARAAEAASGAASAAAGGKV